MPYICDCGRKLDLIAALDALPTDQMGSSGMFCPACSVCGQSIEVRLRNSGFEVGYSYFGGSMHFESIKRVSVKGLKIAVSDPDDLGVILGDRQWHFGIRCLATARYMVFQQAFAVGKRLDVLDFSQWGVTFTGMRRNDVRLEHSPETVIEAGDFLCFSGPAPALTRVWLYINDGISKHPV
jgi:hypothetical protein